VIWGNFSWSQVKTRARFSPTFLRRDRPGLAYDLLTSLLPLPRQHHYCAALLYHPATALLPSFLLPCFPSNPASRHGPVVSPIPRAFFLWAALFLAFRISLPPLLAAGGRQKDQDAAIPIARLSFQILHNRTRSPGLHYLISADPDCPSCLSGGEGLRPVSSNHMLETTPNPRTSRAATTLQLAKVVNLHERVAALDPCPRPSSLHHTIYLPDRTSTTLDMTLWNLYNTLHRESGNRPPSFRLPF
jgi:hypothetical protein